MIDGIRTMVAGISGMGKSYFVKKRLIPLLEKENKPIIIFDRKGEYAGKNAVDASKNWKLYRLREFLGCLSKNGKYPEGVSVIRCMAEKDYNFILRYINAVEKPVTVLLDEAHDIFLDKQFRAASDSVIKLTRWGRSFGIDMIFITQRSKDLPPNIRSQFEFVFSFKQGHIDDVKALDERGWEGVAEVQKLEKRKYLVFGDVPERFKSLNNN